MDFIGRGRESQKGQEKDEELVRGAAFQSAGLQTPQIIQHAACS